MSVPARGAATEPSTIAAVRVPILPTAAYPGARFATTDLREQVTALWGDPVLREAVALASPVLAVAADGAVAGRAIDAKELLGLRRSLLKYALRATTRCTPFGMFSAVAGIRFGGDGLRLDGPGQRHVRLGQPVVKAVRRRVQKGPECLLASSVSVNPVAREVNGRMVVPFSDTSTEAPNTRTDVRMTAALRCVVDLARTSVAVTLLLKNLQQSFPEAPAPMLERFLTELVSTGVLLPDLAASAFDADPANRLRPFDDVLAALEEVRARYEAVPMGTGRPDLEELLRELEQVCPAQSTQHRVQVDTTIPLAGGLPPELSRVAPELLDALERLSVMAPVSPHLVRHARRFVDVFGDTEVPLMDVLDPVIGIGLPEGYPGSEHSRQPVEPVESDAQSTLFATLLERSRTTEVRRVEITEADLSALDVSYSTATSVDVFLEVEPGADGPVLRLGPTGAAFPAGRSSGRFAADDPLLLEHLRQCAEHDRSSHPGVLLLELDYLPAASGATNVALAPSVLPHRLCVTRGRTGVAEEHTIDDILVGVRDDRFYLRDRQSGRPVLVRRNNLLTPTLFSAPVRFLDEVSDDGLVRPSWSWGSLEGRLAFYPEVVCRGVVLSPARWRVPASVITDGDLVRWAEGLGLPRFLHVGLMDNRLLLDRADESHRDLLLRELSPDHRWVSEARDPEGAGWVRGTLSEGSHMAEVVVSVLRREPVAYDVPVPKPVHDSSAPDRHIPPGGEWCSVHIYARPVHQAQVLEALSAAPALPDGAWFFVRYHDGRDHLRVRVRSGAASLSELAEILVPLRAGRIVSDWSVHPYDRELERYAGSDSLAVFERQWCAESAVIATHAELARLAHGGHDEILDRLSRGLTFVESWLTGWGHQDHELDDLLSCATAGYDIEFHATAPALRKQVRGLRPDGRPETAIAASQHNIVPRVEESRVALLGNFPGHPKLEGRTMRAVTAGGSMAPELMEQMRRYTVELSLLHMWCNRLGFSRQEEFQLCFAARNRVRARIHRVQGEGR